MLRESRYCDGVQLTTPRIPRPTLNCEHCGIVQLYPICAACRAKQSKANQKQRYQTTKPKQQQSNNENRYYRTAVWQRLRKACIERDYNQCVVCTSQHRLTAHHIVARKQGGEDALHNLVTLCHSCHSKHEAGNTNTTKRIDRHVKESGEF